MRVPRRPGTDIVDEEKLEKTIRKKIDKQKYSFLGLFPRPNYLLLDLRGC